MYKSTFRIFGQMGLNLILFSAIALIIVYTTINYENLAPEDKSDIKKIWPLFGLIVLYLGYKIFFEINQISIDDNIIQIRNLISRRTKEITKSELSGFKDKLSNGYSVLLIDRSNKVVAIISDRYYKNFDTLKDSLQLNYLGRVSTIWDKLVEIKAADNDTK